jgi:hypothetical protein
MAKVIGNDITIGLSGKFGKLFVFRVVRGKTYACHAPCKPDKRKETAAQRHTRTTFRKATHWAKVAMLNPEKKKYYEELARTWDLTNAYTAAVKDFMRNHANKALTFALESEQKAKEVVKPTPLQPSPEVPIESHAITPEAFHIPRMRNPRPEWSSEVETNRLPALLTSRLAAPLAPAAMAKNRIAEWTGGYPVPGMTRALHQRRIQISGFDISDS